MRDEPAPAPDAPGKGPVLRVLQRVAEVAIALLAISIAVLTLWTAYATIADRGDVDTPLAILLAISYVLTFLAIALLRFATRLAVPRLRIEGGHIIGSAGVGASLALYSILLAGALALGADTAKWMLAALAIGVGLALTWPFKRRRN